MSDPTGDYPPQHRPAGQPPAITPAGFSTPRPPAIPSNPRVALEAGRFWAGAIATALVAALIGLTGALVFEQVFSIELVAPPDPFDTGSHPAAFALSGAVLALLAAGVLHLLIVSTPRPRAFFGWIMALVLVVVTVMPFTSTSDPLSAAMSGLVNLLIGIAVWSLLAGVGARTVVRASTL